MRGFLFAFFLLSSLVAQHPLPVVYLGGGCVTPGSPIELSGFANDQLSFTGDLQPGKMEIKGTKPFTPGDAAFQLVAFGYVDPFLFLPSCGCTLHSSMDTVLSPSAGGTLTVYYGPALFGQQVYIQSIYVPVDFDRTACSEIYLSPVLSDGYCVTLP